MKIHLIIVPYDSGMRGIRMGAGPEALIHAGIVDRLETAGHSVTRETIELPPDSFPAEVQAAFEIDRQVSTAVTKAVSDRRFPLVLSGNCNTALGTLSGLGEERIGIMWFDAHGDFNTPDTTPSGFFDGMALATAAGRCWKQAVSSIPGFATVPENRMVHLGARDFDPEEHTLLAQSEVEVITADQVKTGLAERLESRRGSAAAVYLHIDLDVVDSAEGKANGYAIAGGLSGPDLEKAVREIGGVFPIRAAAMTAYDPEYDVDGRVAAIALSLAACVASMAS